MKRLLYVLGATLVAGWAGLLHAAVPPAEKLLPSDTLLVVSAPDAQKFRAIFKASPQGQLWNDPALKAFKDKFTEKLKADVVTPLERELGFKLEDFEGLALGQFTFALLPGETKEKSDNAKAAPGGLLLMDAGEKSDRLKKKLEGVRKSWTDKGKTLRTEKIRGADFMVLVTTTKDLQKATEKALAKDKDKAAKEKAEPEADKAEDAGKDGKADTKIEFFIGQVDSLLVVSLSAQSIERMLACKDGGLVTPLAENPVFRANQAALFRDAHGYLWVNAKSVVDVVLRLTKKPDADGKPIPMSEQAEKILAASGLTGVTSLASAVNQTPDGYQGLGFVGLPESARRGLFKILAAEAKDAAPPPFVPADAVKYTRWRLDLQKSWAGLETMLGEVFPQIQGVMKMLFDYAGKDKDPNFDLKKELIGNLGDDIVIYQKTPRESTVQGMANAPQIVLLGCRDAEKAAAAFKIVLTSLGQQGTDLKDREFLGRKVYSWSRPAAAARPKAGKPADNAAAQENTLHFAASGGYIAISRDVALLEEHLRSAETKTKALAETPGLAEAAQKCGGFSTGLFNYNNDLETMRAVWALLKKGDGSLGDILGQEALASSASMLEANKSFKEWADFSLLPPFEAVAKYFHFTVFAGGFNPDGFLVKSYGPNPPQLKK